MLRAELVDDLSDAERLAPEWDDLAVRCALPYCSPAWMLSWWRHARPDNASLAIVAVFDGPRLAALAPLFVDVTHRGARRCRMLASGVSARIEPLAPRGTEHDVAPAIVKTLTGRDGRPDFVSFEGVPSTSTWPELFRRWWPHGRPGPWLQREMTLPAPVVSVSGASFDQWLAGRSRNFRQRMRRTRRHLEQAGAVMRCASEADEIDGALHAFFELHHRRWKPRGGSGVLDSRTEKMVQATARELAGTGRFRVYTIEVDGATISAQAFVAAGGTVSYWLGGFDEDWASKAPGIQAILAAVEDAWVRGDRWIDLGAGGHDYKYFLTDTDEQLEWSLLVPRLRHALRRPRLVPWYLARATLGNVPVARRGPLARLRLDDNG